MAALEGASPEMIAQVGKSLDKAALMDRIADLGKLEIIQKGDFRGLKYLLNTV